MYEEKIAPFLELYVRVQDKNYMEQLVDSKPLPEDSTRDASIVWLNETRNTFIHIRSMSYSLDVSEHPRRMLDVLSVLEFLVLESGNISFYEEGDTQDITKNLLEIRELLQAIDTLIHSKTQNTQPTK